MLKPYTTIEAPCEAEFVIKKSRFIGRLFPVESLEEAQDVLEGVKKQYWDATHNCSAAIVGMNGEYSRCSDDGEPQGTAGVPMLETLRASGLTNVLCVVTRYFGGTLLGAGGLVRAYREGVTSVVREAQKVRYEPCTLFRVQFPFKLWGKAEATIRAQGFLIKDIQYSEHVQVQLYTPLGQENVLKKQIAEITGGKIVPDQIKEEYVKQLL